MSGKVSLKFLLILSGIFLIAINIILFYQRIVVNGLKSDFSLEYGKLTRENYLLSEKIIRYMELTRLNLKTGGFPGSEYLFVWRYFDDYCSSCIEQEIIFLKENISSIGIDNVLVLASTDNPRDLKSYFNSHDLGNLELKILPKNEIIISPDTQTNRPFYFVADSTGNATMIFEPDIELPELSKKYFKMVVSRYFSGR